MPFDFFHTRRLKRESKELLVRLEETSRKLEEKILSANEEKNRIFAILESMAEGVVVVDTDQKVVLINTILSRTLGVERRHAEERYYWEIFRDPEINEMIKQALVARVPRRKEHSILLSDSVFEIQVSPVFGREGADFLGIVAVFHDVTKIKRLERMRSEFVANVSHELKTPLTSIMGFVETLKNGAMDDRENRSKFLQIIEEHSARLHHLIEDLLLLSKIESGEKEVKKERVDLEKIFEKIRPLFDDPLRSKGIQLRVEMSPRPFHLLADSLSLEQALSNLIDNAIKYNRPGGEISVRASQEAGTVKIEVSDTGIGITPSDIPRIFERFYRVDKSRSRESGGTGLGLSIVKHIIENHSGTIEVKSIENKGSIFLITLPN